MFEVALFSYLQRIARIDVKKKKIGMDIVELMKIQLQLFKFLSSNYFLKDVNICVNLIILSLLFSRKTKSELQSLWKNESQLYKSEIILI